MALFRMLFVRISKECQMERKSIAEKGAQAIAIRLFSNLLLDKLLLDFKHLEYSCIKYKKNQICQRHMTQHHNII